MFEQTFVQAGAVARRPWTMAASLTIQTGMVGILVLLPLLYTEQLQFRKLAEVFLAPTPPPPAAPRFEPVKAARAEAARESQFLKPNTLVEPRAIPPKPVRIVEEAPPTIVSQTRGIEGGTGEPGASGNSLLTNLLRNTDAGPQAPAAAVPKEAAAPVKPGRVRVGGAVQEAKIISKPLPIYPALARQARVSGVVRLEAVIGTDGRVRELKAVSGHPLLVPAAIEAVRNWLYSPTLLNSDPVEVATVIAVTFTLN